MVKIGEYEGFHCPYGSFWRVEVFETKALELRVWDGVNLIAGQIFAGRRIFDFLSGRYLYRNGAKNKNLSSEKPQNNPDKIITDPKLWTLGKNKPTQ